MTLHLPFWALPVIMTAIIWIGAIAWPVSKGGGDYNFAPAFDAAVHLVVAVVLTLVTWLVFFAILALIP